MQNINIDNDDDDEFASHSLPTLRLLLFGTAKWKELTKLPSFLITMFPKNCPGVNQNGNNGGSFN